MYEEGTHEEAFHSLSFRIGCCVRVVTIHILCVCKDNKSIVGFPHEDTSVCFQAGISQLIRYSLKGILQFGWIAHLHRGVTLVQFYQAKKSMYLSFPPIPLLFRRKASVGCVLKVTFILLIKRKRRQRRHH